MNAKKNMLLVKDDVGKAKPTTRKLPPDGFTFGRAEMKDEEGADKVTSSWKFHDLSKKARPDRDFKKLNKMSVGGHAVNAREMYEFRKAHDARMKEPTGLQKQTIRLPEEGFAYGKPNRPSTPIKGVVGNFFGELAEMEMNDKYSRAQMDPPYAKLVGPEKHTKATMLAKEHVAKKGVEEKEVTQFKMKRFQNVPARTETKRSKSPGF